MSAEPGQPHPFVGMIAALEARALPGAARSEIHGRQHWLQVARVGMELACRTPGADLGLAFWFGLIHDSQRLNDGHDPDHGRRAARSPSPPTDWSCCAGRAPATPTG